MKHLRFPIIFLLFSLLQARGLHATEYVTFSLKFAQEKITSTPKGEDYRKLYPEVFTIGSITNVRGLVYDQNTKDIILVGEKDKGRAILTLDDFVVALRARFIHGKWPLVSIDPTKDSKNTQMQIVRFEGGIDDTQFGEVLFNADYRLKQISMGLLPTGVPGLKSYWDLGMERVREDTIESSKIRSRFWFYPVLPSVSVREDVVAIKGLKVGVFTEVLSAEIDGKKIENLSTFNDSAGDMFAKTVSNNFEGLSKAHQSYLRLQGLLELVALTKAMAEMDKIPDLTFWIKEYRVKELKTKKEVEVLRRKEEYKFQGADRIYTGYQEFSGGVQLMAIALRLKAGDITALRDAVLKTKPKTDALSWSFVVGEWLIPTSTGEIKMEDLAGLFSHAVFLQQNKRYDDAISIYNKILMVKPNFAEAYSNRGSAYVMKGNYAEAISDYDRALDVEPHLTTAYNNRGFVYALLGINLRGITSFIKGSYSKAIVDFSYALSINPYDVNTYIMLGMVYHVKGQYDIAIGQYNKALSLSPEESEIYKYRGLAYADIAEYERAIEDYSYALNLAPNDTQLYRYRGLAFYYKGEHEKAKGDWLKAGEYSPTEGAALSIQQLLESLKGRIW